MEGRAIAGSDQEAVNTPRERQMSRVAAFLYLSGAVLVGGSLLVPDLEPTNQPMLVAVVVVAAAGGLGLGLLGERIRLPAGVHVVTSAVGTLVVTAIVALSDPQIAAIYGVFYVYVAAFDFLYLSLPVAVSETALAAVLYAIVLAARDIPGWIAPWILVTGATVIAGALMGTVGHRARDAFLRERAATNRLRELDTMKNAFLQAVSHELRTPLTVVTGVAQTMRAHLDDLSRDELRDMTDRQVEHAERLRTLLVDLLDVDRLQRGVMGPRPRRVRLDELVQRMLDLTDVGERDVAVELDPVEADLDPAYVERIVENLITNAVRHTPAEAQLAIRATADDDSVHLVVEDAGPGVPDAMKREVFEPFRRSGGHTPGVGIGLSLVEALTTAHGGRVWIEDSRFGGAAFHVLLPRAATDPAHLAARARDDVSAI